MSALTSVKGGPVLIRPHRSIGGLYPDVVVEETHEDSLEITDHPVEQGANISDHAYKKPELVTIRGGVSDCSTRGGEKPSVEFYEMLLELQAKREPFDIVTGKRVHTNMLLESLTEITDADTENSLMFTAQCKQVFIVRTQVATVPPARNHANPGKTAETTDAGQQQPQKRTSILKGGLG